MFQTLSLFFHTYMYFATCVCWATLFLLAYILWPAQRRPMLLSALICAPSAALGLLFRLYWHPPKIFGLSVGVEDLIFAFSMGGLAWWVAAACRRKDFQPPVPFKPSLVRYLSGIILGISAYIALNLIGIGLIWSIYGSIYALGFFLLMRQAGKWLTSLVGAALFALAYGLIFNGYQLIWPNLLDLWNLPALSGVIWGVPLEEWSWALGFGFTWPLFMAYVFDV